MILNYNICIISIYDLILVLKLINININIVIKPHFFKFSEVLYFVISCLLLKDRCGF